MCNCNNTGNECCQNMQYNNFGCGCQMPKNQCECCKKQNDCCQKQEIKCCCFLKRNCGDCNC